MATRSRCGFLIALVLFITIGAREAVRNIGFLEQNEPIVYIGIGTVGFCCWLVGRLREASPASFDPQSANPGTPPAADDALRFLQSAKYWGLIFLLSAGMLSILAICRRKPVLAVQARQPVKPVVTEVPVVVFPKLELQGLVLNGRKSAAVINGCVLQLGEDISNAVLVAVDGEHVTMAMSGQTNVLSLRK